MKYLTRIGMLLLLLLTLIPSSLAFAIPGSDGITLLDSSDTNGLADSAIFKGTYMEYGIYKNGCFGSQRVLTSVLQSKYLLHPINTQAIGFLFDIGKDGWSTGSIPQSGDLFMPGTPYEQWGITFTYEGNDYVIGCTQGGRDFSGGNEGDIEYNTDYTLIYEDGVTLSAVTLSAFPGAYVIKQSGTIELQSVPGAMSVDNYYVTSLNGTRIDMFSVVTNNTANPITNVIYQRAVDGDVVKELAPDSYFTYNTVDRQGEVDNYSQVTARGSSDNTNEYYNIAFSLGAIGANTAAQHSFGDWQINPKWLSPSTGDHPDVGESIYDDVPMAVQVHGGDVSAAGSLVMQTYYELDPSATPNTTPVTDLGTVTSLDLPVELEVDPTENPVDPPSPPSDPNKPSKNRVEITHISPKSGPIAGGTEIVITGKFFQPKNEVRIGGIVASCTYISSTKLICYAPAHRVGNAVISISNNEGTDRFNGFEYLTNVTALPDTGFAQGIVTTIKQQPAGSKYKNYSSLRLTIPSLKVSADIVGVPATEKSWDVEWLGNDAGYLAGSAFPTWLGNSVITGHVWNADNTPGIFANLKSLKYGDQFTVEAFGVTYVYEVRESLQAGIYDVSKLLKHYEDNSWVTLTTCEDYNATSKAYTHRRLVRAVLVKSY